MIELTLLHNGLSSPLKDIVKLPVSDFRAAILERIRKGRRISSMFGMPDGNGVSLLAVIANDKKGILEVCRARVGESYESLTPEAPQAHWFEREIAEQWGITPEGHPWLKPIRFHPSYRGKHDAWNRDPAIPITPGVTDYFRVDGDEIHEVAVGPVHAGVIEPGHFRFQCHGENVLHLEIELGYQHRGIERALIGGPDKKSAHYAETLAGDTSIGHATAHAMIVEALTGAQPSHRAHAIRAISLELERLANHTGDLGALSNDVGFLPTASYCGRLRGDFLNATAMLCGNRFGRNLARPGGVMFDVNEETAREILVRLEQTYRDVRRAVDLMWETPSVVTRYTGTGVVTKEEAQRLGLVGVSARASGVALDVRGDMPWGVYMTHRLPSATLSKGDVFARAGVRSFEINHSMEFIREELRELPPGPIQQKVGAPMEDSLAVALVEGWRGEICHAAITDKAGRFRSYKVTDPSFHNWFGLAMALRGQQISDFPLCNKSFNLSYCGHDL